MMSSDTSVEDLSHKVASLEREVEALRAENEELKGSDSRYRQLFEHLLYEVHIWQVIRDKSGNIKTWRLVDANPAALKSWGLEMKDIIGKETDEIFPGANATEVFMPVVQKIFTENKPYLWETRFEGTNQILQMISIPIGEYFISSGFDVTHLKRTEQQLKDSLLRLSESINAAKVGLWEWDLKTNHVTLSPEWKLQIGYADDEISNNFEEWRSRVHPDDLESTMEEVQNSIEQSA